MRGYLSSWLAFSRVIGGGSRYFRRRISFRQGREALRNRGTAVKSLVCICAGTVAVLAAIQSTEAADAGSWQLHLRGGAEGTLRTEPAQVAKTNGVGQADLLWSQPFPVQANRTTSSACPIAPKMPRWRICFCSGTPTTRTMRRKLDTANDGFAMKCPSNGPACRKRPNSGGTSTAR